MPVNSVSFPPALPWVLLSHGWNPLVIQYFIFSIPLTQRSQRQFNFLRVFPLSTWAALRSFANFMKTSIEAVNNSTETRVLPHTGVFSLHSGQARQISLQMVSLEDVDLISTVLKLTGLPGAKLFYTKPPLTEPPSLLGCQCPDGIFRSLLILHFCCLTLHSL